MTMVSFLPDSVETGWDSHGLSPYVCGRGKAWPWLFSPREEGMPLSSREGEGIRHNPLPPFLFAKKAEEVVMTFALISLREGGQHEGNSALSFQGGGYDHGQPPPSLSKDWLGQSWTQPFTFLEWARPGHGSSLLEKREGRCLLEKERGGDRPQPSISFLSEERAEEVVMTFALISLRKGGLP